MNTPGDTQEGRGLRHVPVLAKEILEIVGIREDGIYCDATTGGGEFARQVIERLTTGKLIALDRDQAVVDRLGALWSGDARVELVRANFEKLQEVWEKGGWRGPDGLFYDLGMSSIQLDDAARGLSFRADGPLDMRLDPEEQVPTAADIVNTYAEDELVAVFREHGEYAAGRIVRRIMRERESSPIETTARLASIVAAAAGKKKQAGTPQPKSSLH